MFKQAIKKAQQAMFPIFSVKPVGNKFQFAVVGTGFFVNTEGVFVSVAHLFDDAGAEYQYRGQLPEFPYNPAVKITEIARDDEMDIFVGQVPIQHTKFMNLQTTHPEIGEEVCIGGYPLAGLSFDSNGSLNSNEIRRYFQPSFILDLSEVQAQASGKTRVHKGFLLRDVGLFGMSGGPIFDEKGTVVGIQGSVTQPRRSLSADGRSISVENAAAIQSSIAATLLKRNRIAYNLFGQWPLSLLKKKVQTATR